MITVGEKMDIDKEIELRKLELEILKLQKELADKSPRYIPVPYHYPDYRPVYPSRPIVTCNSDTSSPEILFKNAVINATKSLFNE